MKKQILTKIVMGAFLVVGTTACDSMHGVLTTTNDILTGGTGEAGPIPLSNEEVVAGLREALEVGTNNSSSKASALDGFWKNDLLRIPFPAEAQKVKDKALDLGLDAQVEKFELTMNRAAEEASKEAKPIFVDAIKGMTIGDGFAILKGEDNAATNYLIDKTSASLRGKFEPIVQSAIDKVELTKYWNPIINKYNTVVSLTGGEKLNPDLNDYITGKAMDGLFLLIAEEEKKIRKDPLARVSDLLERVFGSLTNNE